MRLILLLGLAALSGTSAGGRILSNIWGMVSMSVVVLTSVNSSRRLWVCQM